MMLHRGGKCVSSDAIRAVNKDSNSVALDAPHDAKRVMLESDFGDKTCKNMLNHDLAMECCQ